MILQVEDEIEHRFVNASFAEGNVICESPRNPGLNINYHPLRVRKALGT